MISPAMLAALAAPHRFGPATEAAVRHASVGVGPVDSPSLVGETDWH
jgi:hypothetical protein